LSKKAIFLWSFIFCILVKNLNALEIPFKLEERIILVKACVNGSKPKLFILDTGATETVITPSLANELGIKSRSTGSDQRIGNASISIENLNIRDMPVYIFEPPQALTLRLDHGINYSGILGYTFLVHFITTIDYASKTLEFIPVEQRVTENETSKSYNIPFEIVQQQIFVRGKLNDKGPALLLIDTGAAEIVITHRSAKELKLQGIPMIQPSNALTSTLDSISFFEVSLKDVPVVIFDPPQAIAYGINFDAILGYNFLSKYRITIDYQRRVLTLLPRIDSFPLGAETASE
jgi:predicted aspartyl protease